MKNSQTSKKYITDDVSWLSEWTHKWIQESTYGEPSGTDEVPFTSTEEWGNERRSS